MPTESIYKSKYAPKFMTESQCDFLKDFAIATLFPTEHGDVVQVVPAGQAHYESFSSDELCGKANKIGTPAEEFLFSVKKWKDVFLECEVCKDEGRDECWHIPLTLVLDVPVCRDGSVFGRAKLTAPWPLQIRASSLGPELGVLTTFSLPPDLLFGPYEGVYKHEREKTNNSNFSYAKRTSWPGLKNMLENFIDVSDSALSNWLSFVTFTPHREFANLLPFIFKNCVFYRTCQVIPKDCELVVWTGEGYTFSEHYDNCFSNADLISLVTDFENECPWCNFVFVNSEYLNEHKEHCSVAKDIEIVKTKFSPKNLKILESSTENSCIQDENSLRRSKRRPVKTVKYFDSPDHSPETPERPPCKRIPRSEGMKPRERNHVCHYCKKYFTSLYTLRRHVESHLHEADLICLHCGLVCADDSNLKKHVNHMHEMSFQKRDHPDEVKFVPDFVSDISGDKSPVVVEKDYTYHLGNETCIFDLQWVKLLLKMNKTIRKSNSSSLHCSSCNTQFYSQFAASLHEKNCMEGVKPYKCGHCGKRFQLYFSIVRHMSNHIDTENQTFVDLRFLNENPNANFKDLRERENVHSQMELYIDSQTSNLCIDKGMQHNSLDISSKACSVDSILEYNNSEIKPEDEDEPALNNCSSSCFGTSQTERNTNSSPDDIEYCIAKCSNMKDFMSKLEITESANGGRHRRHECNICGQRFFRRKHIKKHVELHENETNKVYKCSFCMLWFGSEEVVRFHEDQKHANEAKPVQNSEPNRCGRNLLKRLLSLFARESQKGRYCEYFNAKETLKDKRFECEICSKKFTSFYRVRKHKIVSHNELMDLLEAINNVSDFSHYQITESNIFSTLASVKEDKVLEKLKELKSENVLDLNYSDNETSLSGSPTKTPKQKSKSAQNEDDLGIRNGISKQKEVLDGRVISLDIEPSHDADADKLYKLLVGKSDDESSSKCSQLQENSQDVSSNIKDSFVSENSNILFDKNTESAVEITSDKDPCNDKPDSMNQHHRPEQNMKKCKICGKKLSLKTSMKTHMRSHTGERRYECMYCHNRYALLSTLKRHVRIHTNDRPFRCDVCQKAYTQSSNLKRHYRQHTGERPFRCTICPKRYAEKFSLNRHLKTHKDIREFKCKVCYKGFSEQHHLSRHIQIIHGCR